MTACGLLPSSRVDGALHLRGHGPGRRISVAARGPKADGDIVNDTFKSSHSRFDPSDSARQRSVWAPPMGSGFIG
jgi:hypothetical protein